MFYTDTPVAQLARENAWMARKMSAVLSGIVLLLNSQREFSQSAVGWKYSGRVSNYRQSREGREETDDDGRVRRCVTGWFTECVPRNAYRGNHTCVTRDHGARISSSYYRLCVPIALLHVARMQLCRRRIA